MKGVAPVKGMNLRVDVFPFQMWRCNESLRDTPHLLGLGQGGGSRSLTSKLSDWLDKVCKKIVTKKAVNIWNDPWKPCQVADHEELISLPVASLHDLSKTVKIEEVETHGFKDQQKKVNRMVMST